METNLSSVGAVQRGAITQPIKPEWLRIPDAMRVSGICRSSLYELITSRAVKSTSLKKRGALRGIRLVSYDSLMAYIEASATVKEAE